MNLWKMILVFFYVCCIPGFGLPSELLTEQKNPHCLKVTWKKAVGTVTGYRVHCFIGDSQKAEIVKDIPDGNQESEFISGLKPETVYRVAVTSASSGIESKLVFTKDKVTFRKSTMRHVQDQIYSKLESVSNAIFLFQPEFIT